MAIRKTFQDMAFKGLGVSFTGLGFAGIFLPLLPTTPFLLLAAGCFARSSPAFHHWLISHRLLGPYIRSWQRDHSIPFSVKVLSVVMMSASFSSLMLSNEAPDIAVWMTGVFLLCVASWIITRPTTRR